jgi:uncharacterized membrane protein YbaN (DUF454 family)
MDAQLVGLVFTVLGILGFALIVAPALVEIAIFRFRCWRVRRERDRDDQAQRAARRLRDDLGVPRRARIQALHVLSQAERRMSVDHDDAA